MGMHNFFLNILKFLLQVFSFGTYLFFVFSSASFYTQHTMEFSNDPFHAHTHIYVNRIKGFLSIDIDISELHVNQCDKSQLEEYYHARNSKLNHYPDMLNQVEAFHGSHKCHNVSMEVSKIIHDYVFHTD